MGLEAEQVRAALDRILATQAFVRSPRLAGFLRYVVEQRLAGRGDPPKEVEIGARVFGKAADYDPRIEPVVRVQARLLRFKLHEYYDTAGQNDAVHIDLPKGSYWPAFTPLPTPPKDARAAPAPPATDHSHRARGGKPGWTMAAAALLAAASIVISLSFNSWREAASKVWAKTLPVRPKSAPSPAADLYLKGRFYWNKRTPEDLQKALDYFTQSIVADPGYAKAYVGLADCYGLLREFAAMPNSDAWPRALAAARKAVELDDSLAEAHSTLGFDLFYGEFDLKAGEREFQRAVELNPNYAEGHHWYATALMSIGRLSEAADEMQRARELQPASRSILSDQGLLLFYQGKTAQAIEQLRQIETAEPTFRSAHAYLAYIFYVSKDGPRFLTESRKAAESAHNQAQLAVVAAGEKGFAAAGWQGMLESELASQKKLERENRCLAYNIAQTYTGLGRKVDALRYLDASYRNREVNLVALPADPIFASLRREPAYRRLLAQLGVNAVN